MILDRFFMFRLLENNILTQYISILDALGPSRGDQSVTDRGDQNFPIAPTQGKSFNAHYQN